MVALISPPSANSAVCEPWCVRPCVPLCSCPRRPSYVLLFWRLAAGRRHRGYERCGAPGGIGLREKPLRNPPAPVPGEPSVIVWAKVYDRWLWASCLRRAEAATSPPPGAPLTARWQLPAWLIALHAFLRVCVRSPHVRTPPLVRWGFSVWRLFGWSSFRACRYSVPRPLRSAVCESGRKSLPAPCCSCNSTAISA